MVLSFVFHYSTKKTDLPVRFLLFIRYVFFEQGRLRQKPVQVKDVGEPFRREVRSESDVKQNDLNKV
ncbi:hypothetical protein ABH899_002358 [Paenibacillus sp. RC84]